MSEDNSEGKEVETKPRKRKVEVEGSMPIEQAVAYLQSIVDGLKDGSLRFVDGEEPLVLEPGAEVEIEVEAVDKGGKQKLEIEISWGGAEEAGDSHDEEE